MIQAEYRDLIMNAVVPGLEAVAQAIGRKTPGRETTVEQTGPGADLVGTVTLTVKNPSNAKDVFIFRVIAAKRGPESAYAEYHMGPAVVDGKLESSAKGPFDPEELGLDAHIYMVRPKHVQAYVQRRYDEVRAARADIGI